jgi:hypothetical protein
MPSLTTRELYNGRDGSKDEGRREFVRVFIVQQTDAGNVVNPDHVMENAPNLPRQGDPYTGYSAEDADNGVTVRRVRVTTRAPKIWQVECSYSSKQGYGGNLPSESRSSQSGGQQAGGENGPGYPPGFGGGPTGEGTPSSSPVKIDNPLLRPATVRFSSVKRMIVVKRDNNLDLVQNSAGIPFDPPVQMEQARLGMHVQQNVAKFDPTIISTYGYAINSTKWAGGDPKTWRCEDISAERKFEEGIFYWQRSFFFVYKEDGWDPYEVLDQGAGYRATFVDTHLTKFYANGSPLPKGLLNGAGGKLPVGDAAVYKKFNIHDELDFNALKLF